MQIYNLKMFQQILIVSRSELTEILKSFELKRAITFQQVKKWQSYKQIKFKGHKQQQHITDYFAEKQI